MIRSHGHQENGQWIPFEPTPQNDKLPVFSDLLEGIAGQVHLESALDSVYHGIWRCLARCGALDEDLPIIASVLSPKYEVFCRRSIGCFSRRSEPDWR